MPDAPVAAAIVLLVGLILLGLGFFITERRRPGRGHRRRHHRDVERIPLFGTDRLGVHADDVEEAETADDAADAPAPPPRRPVPPRMAPPTHAPVGRSNGHQAPVPAPLTATVEPPSFVPSPPPAYARPAEPPMARPPRPETDAPRDQPYVPPAPSFTPPSRPTPAHAVATVPAPPPPVAAPAARVDDAAFIDGETLSFAVPTDGTLQFLPGRLEVVAGPDTGRDVRFVRTPGETTIEVTFGRSEGPAYRHVQLHARTVSRQHAVMALIDEHWELRNLSTTNPVVLNGRVLAHGEVAPLLVDGDRIEMGEIVFLFHER